MIGPSLRPPAPWSVCTVKTGGSFIRLRRCGAALYRWNPLGWGTFSPNTAEDLQLICQFRNFLALMSRATFAAFCASGNALVDIARSRHENRYGDSLKQTWYG